jgi:quercetin dioxygenase-like cupin family protein
MRSGYLVTLVAVIGLVAHAAAAPSDKQVVVVRREASTPVRGPVERFTGVAHVDSRFTGAKGTRVSSAIVSFEPGARTAWHTHPHGQLLVVVNGCGWVQQEGGAREVIRAGDMIWTPAGVKHWHGAASDSGLSHAAIIENVDAQEVTWMEQVGETEYGSACPSTFNAMRDAILP